MTNPATTEIERVLTEALEIIQLESTLRSINMGTGFRIHEHATKAIARVAALRTQQEPESEPLTDSYVQTVPNKCDRIVWRNRYYALPIQQSPQAAAVHQWRVIPDGSWRDGIPPRRWSNIETRTLYTVVTAKAQEEKPHGYVNENAWAGLLVGAVEWIRLSVRKNVVEDVPVVLTAALESSREAK